MLKDTTLTPVYMPTPNPSESRDDFIDRCMGDDKMVNEFGNPAQRAAVCNSYYDEKSASEEYEDWGIEATAAEYQGKKVTLNKPFRTPGKSKKFAVYTKNGSGTVVIVRFGDPNMEIKRDDPKRRKAFRDRMNCSSPGPKWKANYWSCRMWSKTPVNKMSGEGDCGCGCTGAEAKDKDDPCTTGYEQYGMKIKDGREVPNCVPIKAAEPTPKDDESHDQYMSRCEAAGYTTEECMAAHEGHKFNAYKKDDDEYMSDYDEGTCPPGQEMRNGECQRVAVTLDIDIDNIETSIVATTGETVVRITGTAFHDGVNKNAWGIRPELAARLADEMVGADVTLNHPKAKGGRFTRNMDGGVDEAVVGTVTEGSYHSRKSGYVVKYVAEVRRPELFEALESGLWMKADYGVSIGGTGIPTEIIEADDAGGRPTMWFADDFSFDHLAIVHRPAYSEANIETVERIEASETIKYQTNSSPVQSKVENMTEDINEIENMASELEALKASLVLSEARNAEFEAEKVARVEETRMELVRKASDMGLSGHDDFGMETLESMIASWEASRPALEETVVEMAPVEPASSQPIEASETVSEEPVVANYLNGVLVESSESLYARAYNSWVNAYNGFIATDEKAALKYEDLKQ